MGMGVLYDIPRLYDISENFSRQSEQIIYTASYDDSEYTRIFS